MRRLESLGEGGVGDGRTKSRKRRRRRQLESLGRGRAGDGRTASEMGDFVRLGRGVNE